VQSIICSPVQMSTRTRSAGYDSPLVGRSRSELLPKSRQSKRWSPKILLLLCWLITPCREDFPYTLCSPSQACGLGTICRARPVG
jgi:hypothetical protein